MGLKIPVCKKEEEAILTRTVLACTFLSMRRIKKLFSNQKDFWVYNNRGEEVERSSEGSEIYKIRQGIVGKNETNQELNIKILVGAAIYEKIFHLNKYQGVIMMT